MLYTLVQKEKIVDFFLETTVESHKNQPSFFFRAFYPIFIPFTFTLFFLGSSSSFSSCPFPFQCFSVTLGRSVLDDVASNRTYPIFFLLFFSNHTCFFEVILYISSIFFKETFLLFEKQDKGQGRSRSLKKESL